MAGFVRVIWVAREEVYFFNEDWTGKITLKLLEKIDLSGKIDFVPAGRLPAGQNDGPCGWLLRELDDLRSIFLHAAGAKHRTQPAVPMSMMHIGRVRMRMCQRRVCMGVGVSFAWRITRPMGVVMVFVVSVRMGMRHRLMSVCMLVMFT
jgi:hypothetical protein